MTGFPDSQGPESEEQPEPSEHSREMHEIQLRDELIPATGPLELEAEEPVIDSPTASFLEDFARRPLPPPVRNPNLADVALVIFLMICGYLCSGALLATALHFHLWGVSTVKQAVNDIHYTLGSQAIWYLISFGGCLLLFPAIWGKGFFNGLEWHANTALRKRWLLFSAASVCFVLALADELLIPGPADTPIDQVFRLPGAAWLLFAFGVTVAPFFEEMAFRGFLLPAFCTAVDWTFERVKNLPAPEPDIEGGTHWSLGAMFVGSVLTSIPFALMHAYQTGWSLGPFLLLICVSLVLCWARLSLRSLAASTLVHSSYNLLLFSLMLAGTGGFKHLDKM